MPEFAPKRPDQLETTFVQPTGYWVPISPDGGPTGKTNISDMVRSMDKADTFSLSAGDNNNLAIGDNKFIILNNSTGGQVTLTGMASAGVYSYKVLYVINNGPDPVLLSCGNAGSSSANRFAASDDFVLAKDDSATLIYTTKFMIVGVGTQQATPTTTTSTTTTLIPMQGLKLWLDAQDNASYPGSGNTWTDISGQGNDFNVSGDAFVGTEPKHFNFMGGAWGANKVTGEMGPNANATVILVTQIDPSTADFRELLTGPFNSDYQALTLNDNNLGFYDVDSNNFIDSGVDTDALPASSQSFHFWIFKLSQSSPYWELMYNSTTSQGTITDPNASFTTGIKNIGAVFIDGTYYAQWGKVALALYWDRHLTNGEIDTVIGYFGDRYTTTSTTTEEPTTTTSTEAPATTTSTTTPDPALPIQGNLVAWYDTRDTDSYPGSGTTFFDLTANANDLEMAGQGGGPNPTWVAEAEYFAMGTNGYFTRAGASCVNMPSGNDSFTVSVACRKTGSWQDASLYQLGGQSNLTGHTAFHRASPEGLTQFTSFYSNSMEATLPDNLYEWCVMTYQYDGSTLKMYRNGTFLDDNASPSAYSVDVENGFWHVGWTQGFGPYTLKGDLVGALVYDRALSESEILHNYNYFFSTLPPTTTSTTSTTTEEPTTTTEEPTTTTT